MDIPYTVKPREDTGLFNAKVGIWLFLASEVMLFGALFSSYILLRVGAEAADWPHGLLHIPIGTFNTAVLITSSITVVMAWASLKMGNYKKYVLYQAITICCALAFVGIKSKEYYDKFTHYEIWKVDGTRVTGHLEGNPAFWSDSTLKTKKLDHVMMHLDAPKAGHAEAGAAAHAEHAEAVRIDASQIKRLSAYVPSHSTFFAIYFTLTGLHAIHVIGGMIVMIYLLGQSARMWKSEPERFTNRIEVSGLFWHFVDLVWIFLFPVLYLL